MKSMVARGNLKLIGDRHKSRAHNSVVARKIFYPVSRQNGDPLAAFERARRQRPRNPARHCIKRSVAEFARRVFAAEIDDRGLVEIAVAVDEIAEITSAGHLRTP